MNLDNFVIPKEVQDMISYFSKYRNISKTDWELIINKQYITGAYIYNRVIDKINIFYFLENHPYFVINEQNQLILNKLMIFSSFINCSVAVCFSSERIKLIINLPEENYSLYSEILEWWNIIFQNDLHSKDKIWMICIDFSSYDPGWKIYWKVDSSKFLNLIPDSHRDFIQHVLIKQDISKILPWRNNKIYFKYSWLPQDNFFQEKFPICRETGILKPNYYAIQPENHEESLYYFIDPN